VSDALLLDTHIALWLEHGDERLRTRTRALIDQCWQGGGTVYLSAVSAWEIALLVDTDRIELDVPTEQWVKRFLDYPGVAAAPLDPVTASRAYQFHQLEHRDPADHLLIATAIALACPLVTYDDRIARFAQRHGRKYGFAIER
jgi:PIN domain nuclease of toxin-antitoxin system